MRQEALNDIAAIGEMDDNLGSMGAFL